MADEEQASTSASLLHTNREEDKGDVVGVDKPAQPSGESVKSIVYGGLDAIVTTFSLISSISAGHLSSNGISMGFSDYLSSNTEKYMAEQERVMIDHGVANHLLPQQAELLQTYLALGMSSDDASTIVGIFSRYKDMLVDEKMMTEKRMLPPCHAEKPWKSGLITFAAFILFGSLPLLSFVVLIPFNQSDTTKFWGASILAVFALCILGIAKSKISGQNYLHSVATTASNGCIAAATAYLIGWILRNVAGLEN
ncbi:protein CCC1-like isoform X1 [Canna indica]|uniref:Vacuolar iron transporter n=1 Tax=Canna indica TaxID=4628 RepID=A0AAQ3JPU0_9LILI|nr:protein CCC1-like isoform X1 [Canna indica]